MLEVLVPLCNVEIYLNLALEHRLVVSNSVMSAYSTF